MTAGVSSLAHPTAVLNHIEMEFVDFLRGDQPLQYLMRPLHRDLGVENANSLSYPVEMGINGERWLAQGEEQDTACRFRPDSGQPLKPSLGLGQRKLTEECQVESTIFL